MGGYNLIMEYIVKNGRNIAHEGWVIIDEIEHYIVNGYVFCNSSLNHAAWNITERKTTCLICAANKKLSPKQLKLF